MSIEMDELQKRLNSNKEVFKEDIDFTEFSKIYPTSNENLKEYVKDLYHKRVLCVSSSGDHLLNALNQGAFEIDTFDINRYSPLFQELKMEAIKYLEPQDVLNYFIYYKKKYYLKFREYLRKDLRDFFDYVYRYSDMMINSKLFFKSMGTVYNNNYNDIQSIERLKESLEYLSHRHINANIYALPYYINEPYDAIYFSNILAYENDFDKYLNFVRYMTNYLTPNGTLYYNYIWDKMPNSNISSYYKNDNGVEISHEKLNSHKDIINATKIIQVRPAYNNEKLHPNSSDYVLSIKKKDIIY